MNLKRVLFATITAGMLTATGCAGNVPENNHGNRTGENLGRDIDRSFNYGRTRSNLYNNDLRDGNIYRDGTRYDNEIYPADRYTNPAPRVRRSTRTNRIGNQLRGFGRTTGRRVNDTIRPTVGARNIRPRTDARNNWGIPNVGSDISDNWDNSGRGPWPKRFDTAQNRNRAIVTVKPSPAANIIVSPRARINTGRNNWDSSVVNRSAVRNNRNR